MVLDDELEVTAIVNDLFVGEPEREVVVSEVVTEKKVLPRCVECNKLARHEPAGDGKYYCKSHLPEAEEE